MARIVPTPTADIALARSANDRRSRLALCLSTVAAAAIALTTTPPPAAALPACETILSGYGSSTLITASQVEMQRVTGRDIFGSYANTGIRVSSSSSARQRISRQRSIRRRISRIWRMRIARSLNPSSLRVRHWFSGNGASSTQSLRLSQDNDRKLPVTIHPLPPVVACHNDTYQVVEGGVDIYVDLNQLPAAGRYIAALETTVDLP